MNRDCNIEELVYESQSVGKIVRWSDLQDWLSDKKVIKKGLQPHPYADVLHEWVEGADIVADCDGKHFSDVASSKTKLSGKYSLKVCIKLQEPVYEWQTYYIDAVTRKLVVVKRDSTDDYFLDWEIPEHHIRVEETKRERK